MSARGNGRLSRIFRPLTFLLGLCALPALLPAQTPSVIVTLKANGYQQTTATEQAILDPAFGLNVAFSASVATSTSVQLRGPVTITLPRASGTSYDLTRGFTSEAQLESALPDGNYTLAISGGGTASNTPVTISTRPLIPPVLITNFAELQALSSDSFRIAWGPVAGATSADFIFLTISRNDITIYSTPSPGASGSLNGTATSATISTAALVPGETVSAYFTYVRPNVSIVNGGQTSIVSTTGFNITFPITRLPILRPVIDFQPQSITVAAGNTAVLSVGSTGSGRSYQWRKNGALIAGAIGPSYIVTRAQVADAGNYTVDISNVSGTVTSAPATLNVITTDNVGRITNLAIRSQAGTGAQTLIVGVAIGGAGTVGTKPVLLRAVGPTLGIFGVPGILVDPKLELFSGSTKINENDDWAGNAQILSAASAVGAFALSSPASKDAALYNPAFASGSYSVQITGGGGATGVALAEIYDATAPGAYGPATPRLTNVSARTQVGTGGDILIAGFTIGGLTAKTVLLRAVGPTLGAFGVPGPLADPKLELFSGTAKINENDDWGGATFTAATFLSVGAFPLVATSKDAVLLVTLAPGGYTAQVTGVGATTGVALIEVYEVP